MSIRQDQSPAAFETLENLPIHRAHLPKCLRDEPGDVVCLPEQPPDLQYLEIAPRPVEQPLVAAAKRGQQRIISRRPDSLQQVEHPHGDIVQPVPPDRVFEIERAQPVRGRF